MLMIGVDPHKSSHTAVAVSALGELLGTLSVKANERGFFELLRWARGFDLELTFALEDGRHVTGALERFLLARGERVVRVPPKLMGRERRSGRERGKSDPIDALAVARAALREPGLPEARLAGPEREIRLLVDHREDLVRESNRDINRLRWQLHDLDPDLEPPIRAFRSERTLKRLAGRLARLEQTVQVGIARELLRQIRARLRRERELEREIARRAAEQAPELLEIPGCAGLTAAKLVGELGGIERFGSEAKLAMHAGIAPLDASSGRQRSPTQSLRQPPAELRGSPDCGHPGPDPSAGTRVPRPQGGRGQGTQGGSSLLEKTVGESALEDPAAHGEL